MLLTFSYHIISNTLKLAKCLWFDKREKYDFELIGKCNRTVCGSPDVYHTMCNERHIVSTTAIHWLIRTRLLSYSHAESKHLKATPTFALLDVLPTAQLFTSIFDLIQLKTQATTFNAYSASRVKPQ